MVWTRVACVAIGLVMACVPAATRVPSGPLSTCAVSDADSAWIHRAIHAWRFASREITDAGVAYDFQAIFFDAECVLMS